MVVFFNNLVTFDDVGVVQLLMNLYLLLQQLQIFFISTDFLLINHLDGKLAPSVIDESAQIDLACVPLTQEILFFVLVLLDSYFPLTVRMHWSCIASLGGGF